MQTLKDTATLVVLILLALSVRIDLGDGPSDFGGVRAGSSKPAVEEVSEPAAASSTSTPPAEP